MTSLIDSNVIIALWDKNKQNLTAMRALDEAVLRGPLLVSGIVYSQLLGGYGRTSEQLDRFFGQTGIDVDWRMARPIWEIAGLAYQQYSGRRSRRKGGTPRKILTDFLIGAHAMHHGHSLITQDKGLYRASFPQLKIYYA